MFTREIMEALAGAFPNDEIEFLPRAQSNGKALGLAYIDARSVMRRLDAVVGPGNWSFDFEMLDSHGKQVKGKLTVLGVTKCDAGEAAQEDEPLKSAVSDALKRCAVHFGIGRYLYYLPRVWAPYDAQKRRFIEPPRLDPRAVEEALRLCGVQPAVGSKQPAVGEGGCGVQSAVGSKHSAIGEGGSSLPTADRPLPTELPESSGDRVASSAPAATGVTLVCSGADCGKSLTKGQHDMSIRAFGQPLCPACQKSHARIGA